MPDPLKHIDDIKSTQPTKDKYARSELRVLIAKGHDLIARAPTSPPDEGLQWRTATPGIMRPQPLRIECTTYGCYGMISFSLPFRDGGGERLKLGKLIAAAPPRGVQEPSRRMPLDPVGEAIPLEGDESVIRLGECEGLLGMEVWDKSLDGDVWGPSWD